MNAPFYKFGLFGDNVSLIVAFFIGIGFGFFLERAGFGSARKLTAQFYFTDLTVFKVMFSAIITAMLGLFYLSWMGLVDLSLVYLTPTYLLPQVAGGILLGVGFVVGGYCPGTSCVAVSTGKLDGVVYLLGIIAGIVVFGELFPFLGDFYTATPMGQITLPQLLNVPYGLVVFLVSLMAVGGFAGATWVEKKMASRKGEQTS
ncbi:MAG: Rhodanese domain protein [Acidobacteria bacterium]|nr:Rhodanese domain protein [Acidobacteriota bacterium]